MKQPGSIAAKEISLIIPVKDNQQGINEFLNSFFETQTLAHFPCEIILVDNHSDIPVRIPDQYADSELSIKVYLCEKPGPASARNLGAKRAKGKWLLFVDSDCIPTESMVAGYLDMDNSAIGFQGFVGALGKDYVSRYYESQQIHQPPLKESSQGIEEPKYLVTANILVLKEAFESIEGFDESYPFAGEDVDFGTRLSRVGKLDYARKSVVLHNFDDGFWGLVNRFIKYGKGNRLVQRKLRIPLYPFPFTAKNKAVWVNHLLALVQWVCLLLGFTLKSIELMWKGNRPASVNKTTEF
ncbi:MAG: glycosyltransferase [Roseivirga sp.]|nr:glycosyltransferase [Roseivirga sp.]